MGAILDLNKEQFQWPFPFSKMLCVTYCTVWVKDLKCLGTHISLNTGCHVGVIQCQLFRQMQVKWHCPCKCVVALLCMKLGQVWSLHGTQDLWELTLHKVFLTLSGKNVILICNTQLESLLVRQKNWLDEKDSHINNVQLLHDCLP